MSWYEIKFYSYCIYTIWLVQLCQRPLSAKKWLNEGAPLFVANRRQISASREAMDELCCRLRQRRCCSCCWVAAPTTTMNLGDRNRQLRWKQNLKSGFALCKIQLQIIVSGFRQLVQWCAKVHRWIIAPVGFRPFVVSLRISSLKVGGSGQAFGGHLSNFGGSATCKIWSVLPTIPTDSYSPT